MDAQTAFAPVIADLEHALQGLADVPGMTRRVLDGAPPHLLLFVEGTPGPAPDHAALQTLRAVAGNHGFALEHQAAVLDDGAPLFGCILFRPEPDLTLHWETHPFEQVPSEEGLWIAPIACLADVQSIEGDGNRAALILAPDAAHQIDRLSEAHGHRRYRIRINGEIAGAARTWIPGLRRIPDIPGTAATLAPLHERAQARARARAQLIAEMGLDAAAAWNAPETAPHYREPIFAWALGTPASEIVAPELPWRSATPGAPPRWARLQPGEAAAPVPGHWRFDPGPPASLIAVSAAAPAEEASEAQFHTLLRQHLDQRLALVVRGAVVAEFPVAVARPAAIPLEGLDGGGADQLAAVWRRAHDPAEPALADAGQPDTPDLFQVRLMAEPQDRRLVPVTHYSAPGSPSGTVVAVLNDIVVDGRSVTGARVEEEGGAVYLRVLLDAPGQDALDGACFSNMGKQLAIVFDGRLLSAPTIRDWDRAELRFKGLDEDWPAIARQLAAYLGEAPAARPGA
ncbi:MAG: hypothetical protein KF886_14435 [Candidatus Hydrogenedentes bacterium]|nr:hypothetical protein [Candidatus Hydrogenedentota bacterium]